MTFPRPLGVGPQRPVDAGSGISVDAFQLTPRASLPLTGLDGEMVLLLDGTIWQWLNGAWGVQTDVGITLADADARYRAKPSFVYTQGSAASTWAVNHNLGTYPAVTVVNSAGEVVETGVVYNDANNLTIHAALPFSGRAYLT